MTVCGTPWFNSSQAVRLAPLVARAGFVDPDMDGNSGVVRRVNGRRGGADIDHGQPARVAVGENIDAHPGLFLRGDRANQFEPGGANPAVDRDVLIADFNRELAGTGDAGGGGQGLELSSDPVEGPAQVDGGRARLEEHGVSAVERVVGRIHAQGQPQAPGGRGADEWGTAHQHGADGVGRVVERGETGRDERVGQPGLVDDFDRGAVGGRPEGAGGAAVNVHGEATDGMQLVVPPSDS